MGLDEFALIDRWISAFDPPGPDVVVPPGDDAAALQPSPGKLLVATTDVVVDGIHFQRQRFPPSAVGHKALAVSLSDLAAMGAVPRWALVSLGLPSGVQSRWLDHAARGMAGLAREHRVSLVGGNISRSPVLSIEVTLLGEVHPGRVVRREGARPGDRLWVSGTLGDAQLGVRQLARRKRPPTRLGQLEGRQCRPEPRVRLGQELVRLGIPSAMIDVSDGLAADLRHLLDAGGVGARVALESLPVSRAARIAVSSATDPWAPIVGGGEDYELLFAAAPTQSRRVRGLRRRLELPLTEIGEVTDETGLRLETADGSIYRPPREGWQHR